MGEFFKQKATGECLKAPKLRAVDKPMNGDSNGAPATTSGGTANSAGAAKWKVLVIATQNTVMAARISMALAEVGFLVATLTLVGTRVASITQDPGPLFIPKAVSTPINYPRHHAMVSGSPYLYRRPRSHDATNSTSAHDCLRRQNTSANIRAYRIVESDRRPVFRQCEIRAHFRRTLKTKGYASRRR